MKIGLRISGNSQSCWTFIGLAIRIAQSMGIHRDGDGLSMSAHEAEVRRRVWWQIISLDMRASEDRGCEPMLSECCFNTRLPLNLDDEDFCKTTPHPLKERKGLTEMTYSLMNMEVCRTTQKLHFVPPKHTTAALTLQEKDDLANECITTIDSYFVGNYDSTNPFHQIMYALSRIHVLRLRLVVLYPMQRMSTTLESQPRTRGLKYVVDLLSIVESLAANEYARSFHWHYNTSISWHPLAVALAELCSESTGPLADEAWRVIDKNWARWSIRVASSQEEKMWRPVKSLLRRARQARQRSQPQSYQLQALSLSENNGVQSSSNVEQDGLGNYGTSATAFNSNVPLDIPGQVNSMVDSYQWDFSNGAYPVMGVTADDTIPMNWDEWNAFIRDAGNLDPSFHDGYSS